jgi:hypothetical protein
LLGLVLAARGWAAPAPVTVVAAGDIACDPGDSGFFGGSGTASRCRMKATSDLALSLAPAAVLLLGDNQYENGSLAKYLASYDASWGRLKAITRPVPGNHEYGTPGAAGYFAYFGAAAGEASKGWYSFDLAGWHFVALNSNCAAIGGCGQNSPQRQWLAEDLAARPGRCTLAYWHHPRFSSGPHGSSTATSALWQELRTADADLVLVGHDHIYERFAPQDWFGNFDPAGVRQVVVGTGGKVLTGAGPAAPNSRVVIEDAFGVLALRLYPNGYLWRFQTLDGGGTQDSGGALCQRDGPAGSAVEPSFQPVPRCRVVATRRPAGPNGGPPLVAAGARDFPIADHCGVPGDAVAVALEIKALAATRRGWLTVRPSGAASTAPPPLDFWKHKAFSNSALVRLGEDGQVTVESVVTGNGKGTVHLILDVTGYFR